VSELEELLASAREKLTGAPRERLGSVREPGRIRRAVGGRAVIAPVAEAWHVGVLLIGEEALWRTGSVLRASEEVRRGYTAESQRERAAIRGMAFRGGFAEGETFHYDWAPVSGPDDARRRAHHGPLVARGIPHAARRLPRRADRASAMISPYGRG
jgi:hypothetical protein